MIAKLGRQWFLLALAAVLAAGALGHAELRPLTERLSPNALVAAVLFLMSAPLDLRRSLAGASAIRATAVAVLVNAALAGPLAAAVGPLLTDPLAEGLIIAALAPCTMASAAVWTRRGGGNEAVALTVTVVTSLLSFLVLPAWGSVLLNQSAGFDAWSLGRQLLLIVVLPIAAAQALRRLSRFRAWGDAHRGRLNLAAQLGLLLLVLIGAVRSGRMLDDPTTRIGAADWAMLAAAAAGVHVALFFIAWAGARSVGSEPADALAAGVSGSQKTLSVGLSVAMSFGLLAIIPMIVYHALQLLIDAVLVDRLRVDETPSRGDPVADAPG